VGHVGVDEWTGRPAVQKLDELIETDVIAGSGILGQVDVVTSQPCGQGLRR
jgi:hypothetical protein